MTTPADQPDLVTWLRAQLETDAAEIAKHPDGEDDWIDGGNRSGLIATEEGNYPCAPYLRISKRRALAEVDAKRRILDLYVLDYDADGRAYVVGGYGEAWLDAVRLLALPYADRPGYRDEWRPA